MNKSTFILHSQCELPLELCVCLEGDHLEVLSMVQCLFCCETWQAAEAPGIPLCEYECPGCDEKGHAVLV